MHDGGSGLKLNVGPDLKHSLVCLCLILALTGPTVSQIKLSIALTKCESKEPLYLFYHIINVTI